MNTRSQGPTSAGPGAAFCKRPPSPGILRGHHPSSMGAGWDRIYSDTSPLTWLPAQPDVFSASSLAPPNLHAGPGHLTKMKI